YPLGLYTLEMSYGQDEKDKVSRTFQVQEFRPPRHFAEISFSPFERRDESFVNRPRVEKLVRIKMAGSYYAGGPIKHGRVRWNIYHSPTEYSVLGYEEFSFGWADQDTGQLLESGESVLDEAGQLTIEFPLDRAILSGRRGLKVVATVIDFDGRAASTGQSFQIEPDYLVGLGPHPGQIQAGVEQNLKIIVVDSQAQRLQRGSLKAQVLQDGGAYVRKRNQAGDVYWDYQELMRKIWSTDLELEDGEASFKFDFTWGGRYLVAVTFEDQEGRAFTSAAVFNVVGDSLWDAYHNRDKPFETLMLSADKEAYQPGDKATIFFQPQRPVSCYLVTLEQDGLLEHRLVQAKPGSHRLEIPIDEAHAPNVYLSVLGLSPRGSFPALPTRYDDEAPGFLFGTLNLSVRQKTERLEVAISKGQKKLKAEPGSETFLDLSVLSQSKTGVKAEMAVAVVDESVLALTGFETPSLEGLNRFDLPLAVFTGELRALLLHQTPFEAVEVRPLTGGGGLAGAPQALETKIRQRFDPVAYFNPSLKTDDQGRARVSFTLPDTLTTYRVYVVACDQGSGYASAQRPLLAVKDFYLEAGLPRFFTKGDQFTFGLKAFNKTPQPGRVNLDLSSSDHLSLSISPLSLDLPAQDSVQAAVSGQALKPGRAWALFEGQLDGLGDAVKIKLPINSGHVLGRQVLLRQLKGSAAIDFPLPEELKTAPWEEIGLDEVKCVLTLSGSPFIGLGQAVRYLLRYPYGCVEQTASGIMPLAALRDLIEQGGIPGVKVEETDKYLKTGLERLIGMQTADGGFGYWPGYVRSHPWGSLYAAAALTVARENGLSVPDKSLEKALNYLKRTLKRGPRSETYRAFVAYVLALNQDLERPTLSKLFRDFDEQSREARLLLLLAGSHSGHIDSRRLAAWAREALSQSPLIDRADEFRARFREPAIALLAGRAILGEDPLTDQAALRLMGGLSGRGIWTSTSDTGWSLLALGRYFQGQEMSGQRVRVKVAQKGRPVQTLELEPGAYQSLVLEPRAFLADPRIRLSADTNKTILFQLAASLPRLDYATTGAAQGFIVSKKIENTDGSSKIKVGDLVKVKVTIEAQGKSCRYVMVDDPLPAGLVAINSALETEEAVGGSSITQGQGSGLWGSTPEGHYLFYPNFFEIKDERVLVFRDRLWPGVYEFSY
ncbi:MAG: hypothetical protein JRJ59_07600, partial [Deltaproteobacteria bacterium]|nr:hypothetical protein [Deltaproteobacteria bacterium]